MSKRILVVDNEPAILRVVSARLVSNGYQVISADDGKEGIKKAQEFKPDLILMDIMMPHMSGGETVRILRADHLTRHIPIIFLTAVTANVPKEVEDKGVNVDGEFYRVISKPFDSKELLGIVAGTLTKPFKNRCF